jgi:hypothetical protein
MGNEEIQKLRAALARRERGRGKRYTCQGAAVLTTSGAAKLATCSRPTSMA